MIEILDQGAGKLFATRVSGKLLHRDYQQLVPMLETLIEEHGSVRCYIEMIGFHGIGSEPCGTRSSSTSDTAGRSSIVPSSVARPGKPG